MLKENENKTTDLRWLTAKDMTGCMYKRKKPFPIEKSDGVHGKRERERTTQHENDSETSQNHTDALLLKKNSPVSKRSCLFSFFLLSLMAAIANSFFFVPRHFLFCTHTVLFCVFDC